MRSKKITVYYCDFCKKKMFRKNAMEKHESICTLNPNRMCGMCKLHSEATGEERQKPMEELFMVYKTSGLKGLRKASGNCPVCILSALRQMPIDSISYFDEEKNCLHYFKDGQTYDPNLHFDFQKEAKEHRYQLIDLLPHGTGFRP